MNDLFLKEKTDVQTILLKSFTRENGISTIRLTEAELQRMNKIEDFQYAVVGKFSRGWLELDDLSKNIPT